MLPADDQSEYTPLPLPAPDSKEDTSANAGKRVPVWRRAANCLFVLTLFGIAICAALAWHYWEQSQAFDLNKVAFTQKGSIVHDREGTVMGRLFAPERIPIAVDDLPDHFIDALIATEDNRFFEHPGFDPVGMMRAAITNMKAGDIREGASTITQQLARQSTGLRGRNFDRKFIEIALAVRIEQKFSKHDILEHYLNHIYFGSGYWGVGAAARGYFSKKVTDLNLAESAMLCGLIKSPSSYSPHVNPKITLEERNRSLRNMSELGLLDSALAEATAAKEIQLVKANRNERKPHFLLARIQKEVRNIARENQLPLDGLLIESSVDGYLQRATRGHLQDGLAKVEANPDYPHPSHAEQIKKDTTSRGKAPLPYLQGAAIVVHNRTGQVLAAVGGRDFIGSEYDRAFDARRPPGTAFLPLVYAAAFDQAGIDLATELTDAPMDNRQVMLGGTEGVLGEWGRENFASRYEGQISAALALFDSRNAASVELAHKAGLESIRALAKTSGIDSPLRDYPATFLGQSELTLAELAHAYTMFPNLGASVPKLSMVSRIFGPDGSLLYESPRQPELNSIIPESTAAQISGILRAGLFIGNSRSAYQHLGLKDQSIAGKGGTTHGFSDGWYVGYNNVVTCAVWVGFDKPREIHPRAFSRNIALPIWVDLMNALPQAPLATPRDTVQVDICLRSGLRATETCVENFANGKPYHTGVSLPFPARGKPPGICEHHRRNDLAHLADATSVDRPQPKSQSKKQKPATEPKPISSHSPLVVGPDPYAVLPKK